jgi:predicted nuclease of restriction endonuclease-like RecB superfamily
MLDVYRKAEGEYYREIEVVLDEFPESRERLFPALKKLLEDRTVFAPENEEIAATRWQMILEAQRLRLDQDFESPKDMVAALGEQLDVVPERIGGELYADLAENRKVEGFDDISENLLLHRYNCAQIQFLLLFAKTIRLTLGDASVGLKRKIFQMMKFHNLVAEVRQEKGNLILELSGPLGIFQNQQSYGMRIANFFPYILHMPTWELYAEVRYKQKDATLVATQKLGIQSHYKMTESYVPEEFSQLIAAFNKLGSSWVMEPGGEVLDWGGNVFGIPDFKVVSRKQNGDFYVEVFHKWHKAELSSRLAKIEHNPHQNIILAIHNSLYESRDLEVLVEKCQKLGLKVCEFRSFPTPRAILGLLPG